MPHAITVIRWDNMMGAVLSAKYPEDFNISNDDIMRLYMSHTIGHKVYPFLTLRFGDYNIASYFIKPKETDENFVVSFFLDKDEPGDKFEKLFTDVALEIISKYGTSDFNTFLKEALETINAEIKLTEELPRRILEEYGLTKQEAESYLAMVDKGPISLAEISLYAATSEAEALKIADRLVELGLIKPIPGTRKYYQAIPPYTALLSQLGNFRNFLSSLGEAVPSVLAEQFRSFEDEVNRVKEAISKTFETQLKMKVFKTFIENLITPIVASELENLKSTFEEKVIDALREIVRNVDERINVSQETLSALWKRAKSTISFRFTDVWFVTGKQGFKAQINDMIARSKTRLLIVTPEITDLDTAIFDHLKSWINVRIATHIDKNNPEAMELYDKISKHSNLVIKEYPRKDIWGVDKDREEILIGAVPESGTPVGIASSVGEHIKMFMPIIEKAWVEARRSPEI
ncbi:MAG: helix-turn-helix domain-containing protein [Candidatus Odinarchaeia archaeon]